MAMHVSKWLLVTLTLLLLSACARRPCPDCPDCPPCPPVPPPVADMALPECKRFFYYFQKIIQFLFYFLWKVKCLDKLLSDFYIVRFIKGKAFQIIIVHKMIEDFSAYNYSRRNGNLNAFK